MLLLRSLSLLVRVMDSRKWLVALEAEEVEVDFTEVMASIEVVDVDVVEEVTVVVAEVMVKEEEEEAEVADHEVMDHHEHKANSQATSGVDLFTYSNNIAHVVVVNAV